MKQRRRADSGFWRLATLVWMRKLLLIGILVVVCAATLTFTLLQSPLYEASAEVVVSRQSLAANLSGLSDVNSSASPSRYIDTQAQLARTAMVATATLQQVGVEGRSVDSFLASSSVRTEPNLDILDFRVRDADPTLAANLATAYAAQFVKARQEFDLAAIASARDQIMERIQELVDARDSGSDTYKAFTEKLRQIEVLLALKTSSSDPIIPASEAVQVRPKLARNMVAAVAGAIVLGLVLAVFLDSLYVREEGA